MRLAPFALSANLITLCLPLSRQLSPADLAYQESLVHERENEIREIETGIHELNEIFRDLGTLVQEQGGMLGALSEFAPIEAGN